MANRTFMMIKPDAVSRHLSGLILARLEADGFCLLGMGYLENLPREAAEFLYDEHRERSHFGDLVAYTVSGPVVLLALSRDDAVSRGRELIGVSDPAKAAAGTLRKEFGVDYRRNSIHASDGNAAAKRELKFFFPQLQT